RTMSLPLRRASTPGSAQVPAQRRPDIASSSAQAARIEQWMSIAMRPDLYDAPVQREEAGGAHEVAASPLSGGGRSTPEDVRDKSGAGRDVVEGQSATCAVQRYGSGHVVQRYVMIEPGEKSYPTKWERKP